MTAAVTTTTTTQSAPVAAWVGARPITVAEVDRRMAVLREGPLASRLPPEGTPQGRNLRRWLVQVLTVEELVVQQAAVYDVVCEPCDGEPESVELAEALRAGGVTAAVLAAYPLARALRRTIVAGIDVSEHEVRAYYDRNRDRHAGAFAKEYLAIRRCLLDAARERAFSRWLDRLVAQSVRLEHGFEHPADPRQPDADHHH